MWCQVLTHRFSPYLTLLFLAVFVTTAERDPAKVISKAIKNGKPTRIAAGGCGFKLTVPEKCRFQMATFPNSTDEDCSFAKLGLRVLVQESVDVARGVCQKGLSVTNFVKNGEEEVEWEFKIYRMNKVTGANGYLRELKLNDILTPAIKEAGNLVGVTLDELHIPGTVRNASIFGVYEEKTKDIWLGVAGSNGTCTATVVSNYKRKAKFPGVALGVSCPQQKLRSFLDRFGGGGLNLDFLEKAQYTVILSTMDIEGSNGKAFFYKAKHLNDFENVTTGLNLVAKVDRPTDCRSSFCRFLAENMQADGQIELEGIIQNRTDIKAGARIPFEIKINDNARMRDLVLEVGTQSKELAVRLDFEIQEPKLLFSGGIRASSSGLSLEAYTGHVWEQAFGLPCVAFGDLILSLTFQPPRPALAALQLGGRLLLGRKPTSNLEPDQRVQARAYIGIDTTNPEDNYFYAHVNMTVEKLLAAFNVKADIPDVIAESGFPNGMLASYSGMFHGKQLPEINLDIPHGLHINGTMNVLGLVSTCKVHINFKLSDILVFMNITLPVVRLGGIASLRAAQDKEIGAHAFVSFTEEDPKGAKAIFEGYLELLGMYRFATMNVNSSMFEVTTGGGLFNFEAKMTVIAEYGSIEDAKFTIAASLTDDSKLKELSATLKKQLQQKLTEGKKRLQKAHKDLSDAKEDCRKKMTLECDDCAGAQNAICDNTVVKPCQVGCNVVFWDKKGCRKKCVKGGQDCKRGINKACAGSCKAIDVVGKGLCENVEVAQASVTAIEKAYGSIIDVSIEGLGALEIFKLNHVRFETGLSVQARAEFECELDVIVLKKPFHLQYKINLELLSKGDKRAIGELFSGIYDEVKNAFTPE